MAHEIEWIYKEPSPTLLMSADAFKDWKGKPATSRKSVSRVDSDGRDYLLFAGGSFLHAGWLPEEPAGGFVIFSDSNTEPTTADIVEILKRAPEKVWKDTELGFEVTKIDHVLTSSFETLESVETLAKYGAVEVQLDVGTYNLKRAKYPGDGFNLEFYRLCPIDVKAGKALQRREQVRAEKEAEAVKRLKVIGEALRTQSAKDLKEILFVAKPWTPEMLTDAFSWLKTTADSDLASLLLSKLELQKLNADQKRDLLSASLHSRQRELGLGANELSAKNLNEFVTWKLQNSFALGAFEQKSVQNEPLNELTLKKSFESTENSYPFFILRAQMLAWKNQDDLQLFLRAFFGVGVITNRKVDEDSRIYAALVDFARELPELEPLTLDAEVFETYMIDFEAGLGGMAEKLSQLTIATEPRKWWLALLKSRTDSFAKRVRSSAKNSVVIAALQAQLKKVSDEKPSEFNNDLRQNLEGAIAEWSV